ncbi:MAG: DUF4397 domain-containing protein, partial [Bacteroidota bacterium]
VAPAEATGKANPPTLAPATPPVLQPTAMVQIIHNAASESVNISANGNTLLNAFAYRTATPYLALPAGVELNIDITPVNGTAGLSTSLTLDADQTYVVVANGTFDPSDDVPVSLSVFEAAQRKAGGANQVAVQFIHGALDAPAVDIVSGGTAVFDDVRYGQFDESYQNLPAGSYRLDVTPADDNTAVLASYVANLEFWKGRSLVVFAGGNLSDGSFEPWVALSNGGTFPLSPAASNRTAEIQPAASVANQMHTQEFLILGLSPNPTKDEHTLQFVVNQPGHLNIELMNVEGKVLRQLINAPQEAGMFNWSQQVGDLPKGLYFYRIRFNNEVMTHRFIKQ